MEVFLSNTRAISLFLVMFNVVVLAFGTTSTRVLTQQGYVRGIQQDIQTNDGQTKTIYKFLGVPYAQEPIRDLRFMPPQAPSNRNSSDYDATFLRPICVQENNSFDSIRRAWPGFDPNSDMNENCLFLNIYTPNTRGRRKYPVIVYIHGGSYMSGTPTLDISPGEYLPTRDVVLVTIQYRLGTFGFFTNGNSEAPGNVGLLDQVEALNWVQQNIDGFGGNKNSVTLLGESAGGSIVGLHYLSPLSKGLFHRGIAVSGVDLSSFALLPKSTVLGASNRFVKKVNCITQSHQETVCCLRSLPSATVFEDSDYWEMAPFVDQHFLPDEPKILRKQGNFSKLPLISGFVSQEGSHVLESQPPNVSDDTKLRTYLESFFRWRIGRTVDQARAAFDAFKSQYTPAINNASEYQKELLDLWSDFTVIAPTVRVLSIHSDTGTATYMYEFAHRSQNHLKPKWMGVVHGDTIPYMFGLPLLRSNPSELTFNDNDRNISDMVVTMFTNFAKFGSPTSTPVHGVQWTPFNKVNKAYLKIQSNPVMTRNYHPQRMNFWNSRLPKLLSNNSTSPSSDESESSTADVMQDKPYRMLIW